MKRRAFIRNTGLAGIAGGIVLNMSGTLSAEDKKQNKTDGKCDLAVIKGGGAAEMFDRGIAEFGGMKTFVKKGQTVVLKPNIGWARTPETAANTNPELVGRIAEHCIKAGAAKVYVLDHTCNNWQESYKKSGIESAVTKVGAKTVCGNNKKDYIKVAVKKGKKLKSALVHKLVMECDVFINIPVLKNHGGAVMTCAMKNLMGIVWDRRYFHKNNLQQTIADFVTARKPDLNIVDAFRVMKKGGPRGRKLSDVATMKYQIISPDIVAIDMAASKILGISADKIPHIGLAEKLGLGTMNLDKLKISRITV